MLKMLCPFYPRLKFKHVSNVDESGVIIRHLIEKEICLVSEMIVNLLRILHAAVTICAWE